MKPTCIWKITRSSAKKLDQPNKPGWVFAHKRHLKHALSEPRGLYSVRCGKLALSKGALEVVGHGL